MKKIIMMGIMVLAMTSLYPQNKVYAYTSEVSSNTSNIVEEIIGDNTIQLDVNAVVNEYIWILVPYRYESSTEITISWIFPGGMKKQGTVSVLGSTYVLYRSEHKNLGETNLKIKLY